MKIGVDDWHFKYSENDTLLLDVFLDNGQHAMLEVNGMKNPQPKEFVDAARVLIFLKGRDAHDYKFSSAVLEDYQHVSPAWRDRYLAASVFNLRGSGDSNNDLVKRTRAALQG